MEEAKKASGINEDDVENYFGTQLARRAEQALGLTPRQLKAR